MTLRPRSVARSVLTLFLAALLGVSQPSPGEAARGSLQAVVERAVGDVDACVVVLDARTGAALAVVNPRMATEAFPPGSIAKLAVAYEGLQENAINRRSILDCRNAWRCGTRRLICSKPGGHGRVDVEDALASSCSVFFYHLGELLGPRRLLAAFRRFGFTIPGSLANQYAVDEAAVGQCDGLRATPVQVAMMVAAVANGGTLYGSELGSHPRVLAKLSPRAGVIETVRSGMRRCVAEGTGKRASVDGLEVAGKTGSPPVPAKPQYRHAWFAGFAPYKQPQVVVVVFARWGHGGDSAAPIAARVFRAWDALRRVGKRR